MKMEFIERFMIPEGMRIPVLGGIIYRTFTKIRRKRVSKIQINTLSLNRQKRDKKLIFTLTSFPDRINSVQNTLKTLFTQSMKPDRVILWLAESEFEGKELPDSVKEFQKVGLEVRYCDNYFEHKRYYKLLGEQKEDELIVMFDDDILFPKYLVERLYNKWKEFPTAIVCERGQTIEIAADGGVGNPGRWSAIGSAGVKEPSFGVLISPGGGCLVPPNALFCDACNTEKIEKYALKTGDLWLMFMAAQNDTKVVRPFRYHRIFILSEDEQAVQLGRDGIYQGRYIKVFVALSKAYPKAYANIMASANKKS